MAAWRSPREISRNGGQAAPHGCYRCKGEDRWCVIAVFSEEEWQSLCNVMGRPLLARQDKFASIVSRLEHAEELDSLIEGWTMKHTPREVIQELQSAGVPAAAVNDAQDLVDDPHLNERGFFIELEHPILGLRRADGNPVRLSTAPPQYNKAAPLLGEDNRRVFVDTLRNIEQGEELTFDYKLDVGTVSVAGQQLFACHCRAPNCRGTMLALPNG